jgi:hypothetical protein
MRKWALFLLLLVSVQCFGTPTRHRHYRPKPKARRIQPLPRLHCYDRVFYGSRESQLLQNAEIDRIGIPRIQNDIELRRLVRNGELVPVYRGEGIVISPKLSASRLYVRPWVNDFLSGLGAAYHERFGSSLQINSVTRTVQEQRRLTRYNGNAAPAKGEIASSHLAGITVDIGRRNLTAAQVQFLEGHLLALGDAVIVIEEIRQPCFHICVCKPMFRVPLAPLPPELFESKEVLPKAEI